MHKNKVKRLFSWLLILIMLFSFAPTAIGAEKTVQPISVTLTVSDTNGNMVLPKTLMVAYEKFSDLGLTGIVNDDPGYITPLHVLASYYIQEKNATAANMNTFLTVDEQGNVTSVDGSNGGGSWKFAVNDKIPAVEDVRNTFTDLTLADNDNLCVFGISDNTQLYSSIRVYPQQAGANAEFQIYISAVPLTTYNTTPGATTYDMTGATPLVYKSNGDGSLALLTEGTDYTYRLEDKALLRKYGICYITVKDPGTYYVSGQLISNEEKITSFPISGAIEVIDENLWKIEKDWNSWTYQNNEVSSGSILYSGSAWVGKEYGTPRSIVSGNPDILEFTNSSDKLQVVSHRENLLEDTYVPVTVSMDLGEYHREATYNTLVYATTALRELKVEGVRDIGFDKNIKTYSVPIPVMLILLISAVYLIQR